VRRRNKRRDAGGDDSPTMTLPRVPAEDPRPAEQEEPAPRRRPRRGRLLGRFSIRSKLNILLVLALAVVLLVATPFVAIQIDNARAAGRTADAARNARAVGGLAWELQRERLVTTAYLASPSVGSDEVVRQQRQVDVTAEDVRAALGREASDELLAALVRLGSLQDARQSALLRAISPDSVARTYHAVIEALIDALRLVPQETGDAEGTRELAALDALLRANEFSALRGVALIGATVNRETGLVVLTDAAARAPLFIEQFVEQADPEHAALVVRVEQGEAGRRIDALATELTSPEGPLQPAAFVGLAFEGVDSLAGQRRSAEDQVTGQIADAASSRAAGAQELTALIGFGGAALFALVAALAIAIRRSIVRPLRQLTTAATTVANLADAELTRVTDSEEAAEQVPQLAPIETRTDDELGELATAFNRVQSTASRLVERQAVRRKNVSLMFANVAQRTQNLVGRQLALVDELERNEQDGRLLASLYQLDHLSTRLRRTADNLLVVAGAKDETRLAGPIPIATALRSALAEIEDYQRVEISDVGDLRLAASFGSDAVLVFAELLENATSFSPPGSVVTVDTDVRDGVCVVSIIDHGIGMPPDRLAEENRRLVEREQLDIAPTTVLGLFVVGRLARRHGLRVELDTTPGGGVTARVVIPPALYEVVPAPEPPPPPPVVPAAPTSAQSIFSVPELIIPSAAPSDGFSWFRTPPEPQPAVAAPQVPELPPAVAPPPVPGPPAPEPLVMGAPPPPSRGGLQRRVPGAQLADTAVQPSAAAPSGRPFHDAEAARAAFDGFQSGIANAAAVESVPPAGGPPSGHASGLSRRVPGASLAPGLRGAPARSQETSAPAPPARVRDPDAELAAFDGFTAGLVRAGSGSPDPAPNPAPRPRPYTGEDRPK
jgi:signal transduction histidine kinase